MERSYVLGYHGVYNGRRLLEVDIGRMRDTLFFEEYFRRITILGENPARYSVFVYEDEYEECIRRYEQFKIRQQDMMYMGSSRLQGDLCSDSCYITQGACMTGVDYGYGCSGNFKEVKEEPKKSKPVISSHDIALKKVFWASRRLKELK